MAKDPCIFHQATIGGLSFYLTINTDGPYIGLSGAGAGVAIGNCTSIENTGTTEDPSYCVCKYKNQQRIHLQGFGLEEVQAFSAEFGIPFGFTGDWHDCGIYFSESAAFKSLVEWRKAHPKLFGKHKKHTNYMPWVAMVDNELNPIPDIDEYLEKTAKVGDVFTVESHEMIEMEWEFQIIAILEQKGKRFYVGAKTGVDLSDLQIILFDKDGDEIDTGGSGSSLRFYLCEKTKKRKAKTFAMVGQK